MKKKILILGLFMIILTACGSKKDTSKNLRCSKTDVVSENTVNEIITATFENNEIKTSDMRIETIVAEKYIDYIDVLEENVKNQYADYYNKPGIDINVSVGTDSINTKINFDFSMLDDTSKALLGLSSTTSTYDETKKMFETSGYKCD